MYFTTKRVYARCIFICWQEYLILNKADVKIAISVRYYIQTYRYPKIHISRCAMSYIFEMCMEDMYK